MPGKRDIKAMTSDAILIAPRNKHQAEVGCRCFVEDPHQSRVVKGDQQSALVVVSHSRGQQVVTDREN